MARESDHPAPYDAPPSALALLRGTWGRREYLDAKEREIVSSLLTRTRTRALTEAQLELAKKIGRRVGVGYDDPADEAPIRDACFVPLQPWGALPMKPPARP